PFFRPLNAAGLPFGFSLMLTRVRRGSRETEAESWRIIRRRLKHVWLEGRLVSRQCRSDGLAHRRTELTHVAPPCSQTARLHEFRARAELATDLAHDALDKERDVIESLAQRGYRDRAIRESRV